MQRTVMINSVNYELFDEYIKAHNSKRSVVINNLLYFFYNTTDKFKISFLNEYDDNSIHDKPVGLYIKNKTLIEETKKYGFTQVMNILINYFNVSDDDIKKSFLRKYV